VPQVTAANVPVPMTGRKRLAANFAGLGRAAVFDAEQSRVEWKVPIAGRQAGSQNLCSQFE